MSRVSARSAPKGLVVAVTGAAVLLLLASGARTWVNGRVSDAVLADSAVSVAGRSAAPGVLAAALVAAAAAIAAITGGRIVRWVGAAALTLAGVLVIVLAGSVIADAAAVVGRQAATETGRTGSVTATGEATGWALSALVAGVVLLMAGLAALASVPTWGGLTGRYDAPTEAVTSQRETRRESDWDRLSRGEDPT